MSADTTLTAADVAAAYRFLLGREPENEKAIAFGLTAGSPAELRKRILNSAEFAERLMRETPHAVRRLMLEEMQAGPVRQAESEAARPPRIVFLHIMKTAGSTIRRRLEEAAAGEPVWRREADGLPGSVKAGELARYRVVMGHFSMADARHVPRPRRIFTVLREPRERIVSHYHYLARHRAEVAARPGFERAKLAREISLEEYLTHRDPAVQADMKNVITRTLAGDYVVAGRNLYRQPWQQPSKGITGAQLLRRAIGNLFSLDFVTFTDRLEQDRRRLEKALGLPDMGPWPRENTRELVSDTLEPRPEPEITPGARRALNRLTDLDRVLYRLARDHLG